MYYFIHFTWGLLLNLIGLPTFLFCKYILGYQSVRYRKSFEIIIPKISSGLSLGIFLFIGEDAQSLQPHEYGHTIQNLIWGPLKPFVISIPSCARFWYREYLVQYKNKKYSDLPDYDAIWFEGQATNFGNRAAAGEWKWL